MDIVVSSRQVDLTDSFRDWVAEKLARLEKHDHRLIRVEVKVEKQSERVADRAIKVELTAKSKGPVVRAEAIAEDQRSALDIALDRMAAQLRRAADRKKIHRGQHGLQSTREMFDQIISKDAVELTTVDATDQHMEGSVLVTGDGPLVVREKTHEAKPMTVEQALYEMELVGHNFYLFVDKDTGRPAVVYRRIGYDYGVISLELEK